MVNGHKTLKEIHMNKKGIPKEPISLEKILSNKDTFKEAKTSKFEKYIEK
jgi:hypothetical protein